MSIKLTSLRKNDIRRKIVFTNQEGEKEIITVKNPDNESKVKLMEFLADRIGDNDTEITIEPKDILVNLLPLLTNIEIDTNDVDVIIENPSTQLTEVFYHLGEIIQETINEMLMIQSSNLSMVGQNSIMEDIQNKIEKTVQDTPKKGRKKKVN